MKIYTRKKTVILSAAVLLIITSVIVLLLTRVEYYNDFKGNAPKLTDVQYLDTFDLRTLIIFEDDGINSELEEIAETLITAATNDPQTALQQYADIITQENLARLSANGASEKGYDFELTSVDTECVSNGNKAIVFWTTECKLSDEQNNVSCRVTPDGNPLSRIYFEKIKGKWVVTDCFIPA